MSAIFPLDFATDEVRLLSAIVIGVFFGFALERGGFGNARKLAAQFYLYDMAVFKVMFTAILVAMVGFYSLAGIGLVDPSLMWVNPTFVWAQVVGGFLLGVGFVMSGLCPGTSFVAAASGRYDGWVAIGGVFVGTFAFAVVVDWFPGLKALYEGGSMGVSFLYDVFDLSATNFVLIIVVVAAAGFLGAEMVERAFSDRFERLPLSPVRTRLTPRLNSAFVGALAVVALVAATGWAPNNGLTESVSMNSISAFEVAERLIAGDPELLILDARDSTEREAGLIPQAYSVVINEDAPTVLATAGAATTVVVVFSEGADSIDVPSSWPAGPIYSAMRGGWEGWRSEVLEPQIAGSYDAEARALAARKAQVGAYFSGSVIDASSVAAPPPVMSSGGATRRKAGGC